MRREHDGPLRIGVFAPLLSPVAGPDYLRTLGRTAESLGFHSLWIPEHVVLFGEYASRYPYAPDGKLPVKPDAGFLEPFTALSYLAACTTTIRLGIGVCLVPQRNPVYLAKEAAGVDWLSGGRLDLGIGVGWLAEEFHAVGVPFASRGARCDEYIEVMRRLWTDDVAEFHGELWSLPPCRQDPKPVQQPHPPIHVGGDTDAALGRVADLGQGWAPFSMTPDDLAKRLGDLDAVLADRGRSRHEIEVSVFPYLLPTGAKDIRRYRDAGANQVVVMAAAADAGALEDALERLAATYLDRARSL